MEKTRIKLQSREELCKEIWVSLGIITNPVVVEELNRAIAECRVNSFVSVDCEGYLMTHNKDSYGHVEFGVCGNNLVVNIYRRKEVAVEIVERRAE